MELALDIILTLLAIGVGVVIGRESVTKEKTPQVKAPEGSLVVEKDSDGNVTSIVLTEKGRQFLKDRAANRRGRVPGFAGTFYSSDKS